MENKPAAVRFDPDKIDLVNLKKIVKTGRVDGVLTTEEVQYFQFMDMVRGWLTQSRLPGKQEANTKPGIINLLKEQYNLSDWQARRVYADTLNFFFYRRGSFRKSVE